MKKLLIIVIDSGTGRSTPLMKQLNSSVEIEVKIIPANMLRTEKDLEISGIKYSKENSLKYLGRPMSLPEIGCASSHNRARYLLASTLSGGVILEDDGRICNLDSFISLSKSFLIARIQDCAVLNLSNSNSLSGTCSDSRDIDRYYVRKVSPTPLAVGYAITSSAAKRMCSNNDPIEYVSDWPSTGVAFYSPSHQFIHHGDGMTVSTIDPSQSSLRHDRSFFRSLSVLLGVHFILQALRFGFDGSYFQKVWWVTFSDKVSFLRGFKRHAE